MPDTVSPQVRRETDEFRAMLGMNLIRRSGAGLVAISVVAIVAAAVADFADGTRNLTVETTRMVFTSVLPLLGTWVGTVLAFYFTKEGLEVASRTTLDAVRSGIQPLEQKLVRDKMIPTSGIEALQIPAGKRLGDATYGDIASRFKKTIPGTTRPITRLPIFDADGKALGIIHDSAWLGLLNLCLLKDLKPSDETSLASMLETARPAIDYRARITASIAFVAVEATLADAKSRMEAVAGAQDVFVTTSGSNSEPVQGWLPNVVIAKESRA